MATITYQELIQLKEEVDAISQKLAKYIEKQEQDENIPEILKEDLMKFIFSSLDIPNTVYTRLANVVSECVFGRQRDKLENGQTITIGKFVENYSMKDLFKCRNAGKKTVRSLQNAFKDVGIEWK